MKLEMLIADDHGMVRKGVRKLLREHSDIRVVGEAHNGEQVLERDPLQIGLGDENTTFSTG